jgi:hypothetical protein
LLIVQTKVINETFLKLFVVKAQPYFKKLGKQPSFTYQCFSDDGHFMKAEQNPWKVAEEKRQFQML